ncbi:Os07g0110500, partial [Oryza sativa Japonica Group]
WNERNLGKVRSIEKILSKRDMVRESSESLILERMKKIGTHNTKHAWMVAGVTISGYLFGAAFVALLTESQLPKREEEKEA